MVVFFLAGVGWGVWSHRADLKRMARATPLRVLCGENWLSPSVLEEFSRKNHVPVQLWTYARPSELLRQMANTSGRIDVVCTSSMLLRSLVRNQWLMKQDYRDLRHLQEVAVDFRHLPYDPRGEYQVPLFWNLYGLVGQSEDPPDWKRVAYWGEELIILDAVTRAGIPLTEEDEGPRRGPPHIERARQFLAGLAPLLAPTRELGAEVLAGRVDWALAPLARAKVSEEQRFHLPEEGSILEVGVIGVGARSEQPELARKLIDMLLKAEHGAEVHARLGAGVVHPTLDHTVPKGAQSSALRRFPLNRYRFPDLDVEALPRFQKIFDERLAQRSK